MSAAPKSNLPSIAEIYNNDAMPVLSKDSLFQVLVNQPPKPEWIKQHPMTKDPYIPIERIEWLLTNIFLNWRVEVKTVQLIGNSVCVTVRLHYYNHTNQEWLWQDGVGAQPLQTAQGAGAIEFDKLKSNAVQIGAPSAESYAVKDAAEKIGKLFGKDLNRKELISYDTLADRYEKVMN
jgi:hypothetical protein